MIIISLEKRGILEKNKLKIEILILILIEE